MTRAMTLRCWGTSFVFAVFMTVPAWAQRGDLPISFDRTDILPLDRIDLRLMPTVDVAALIAEDERLLSTVVPPRIGTKLKTDLNTSNSGTWEDLPEGAQQQHGRNRRATDEQRQP